MEVHGQAWRGEPAMLNTEVTPLLVEITNNSPHPLLARYESMQLKQDGRMYRAMPPYDIEGTVKERYTVANFPYTGFTVAPYLSRYYPGLVVADPFFYDPAFYNTMVPAFRPPLRCHRSTKAAL